MNTFINFIMVFLLVAVGVMLCVLCGVVYSVWWCNKQDDEKEKCIVEKVMDELFTTKEEVINKHILEYRIGLVIGLLNEFYKNNKVNQDAFEQLKMCLENIV